MGKVNEYQRKQLASSVVGVSPADQSGQMISASVSQAASVLAGKEAKRAEVMFTVQANNAVTKFNLAFQTLGAQIAKEKADNPEGAAEFILQEGQKLIDSYADGIKSETVRGKFLTSASVSLKGGVLEMNKWAIAKRDENAMIAAADTYRLGIINVGNTTTIDQLNQNLTTLKEDLAEDILEVVSGPDGDRTIGHAEVKKYNDKNMPGAIESHLGNRVLDNPEQLIADLKERKYEGVEYFTDTMEKKYIGAAQTRIRHNRTLVNQAQTDNFAEALDMEVQGQLSFNMIDALATAQNPVEGVSSRNVASLKRMLISKVESNAADLERSNPKAAKYVDLLYKTMENREERAEVLEQLVDVYTDGIVTNEETTWINKMSREKKDILWDRKRVELLNSAKNISSAVHGALVGDGAVNKEAGYLRRLLSATMTGVSPVNAGQLILNEIKKDKVVGDNPNLAAFEDPVAEAYNLQAISLLKAAGYPLSKANIEGAAAQLKEAENKPKV